MAHINKLDIDLVSVTNISCINDDAVNYEIEYCGDNYPLYVIFNNIDVYFTIYDDEKYLVIAANDKNEEVLEKHEKLLDKIKDEIKKINGKYGVVSFFGDYRWIKFKWDDNVVLNEMINLPFCVLIIKSVYEEKEGRCYSQIFLDDCCLKYNNNNDNTYTCLKSI